MLSVRSCCQSPHRSPWPSRPTASHYPHPRSSSLLLSSLLLFPPSPSVSRSQPLRCEDQIPTLTPLSEPGGARGILSVISECVPLCLTWALLTSYFLLGLPPQLVSVTLIPRLTFLPSPSCSPCGGAMGWAGAEKNEELVPVFESWRAAPGSARTGGRHRGRGMGRGRGPRSIRESSFSHHVENTPQGSALPPSL